MSQRALDPSPLEMDAMFRLYARELNDFAYRRLRDREAAADIVQDGFERFIRWTRRRVEVERAASPRFFLWTVVGNLTLDLIRRNRLNLFQPMTPAAEAVADPAPTADRWLEARQQYRVVRAALDELPPRHRTALLLNRIEGLTHAEIAVKLGVSPSMVSKYIMAAFELCLIRLAPYRR